jgi:hypothetical protein
MKHSEFEIGGEFSCAGRRWRCTDKGSRVVIAIRLDEVHVTGTNPRKMRTLNREQAEAEGWFNGPPYAVAERVFDEEDQRGCSCDAEIVQIGR